MRREPNLGLRLHDGPDYVTAAAFNENTEIIGAVIGDPAGYLGVSDRDLIDMINEALRTGSSPPPFLNRETMTWWQWDQATVQYVDTERPPSAIISEVSAETIPYDQAGSAENLGDELDVQLHLKVPQGIPGVAATLRAGATTTIAPNLPANAIERGTPQDQIFDFEIPRGETGAGLRILGQFDTLYELIQTHLTGNPGDMYSVGPEVPRDMYQWNEALGEWVNEGPMAGAEDAGALPFDLSAAKPISTREAINTLTDSLAQMGRELPFTWAEISENIKAGNPEGIRNHDYISFETTNGYTVTVEANVDTYYNYGDTPVPHHVDFIGRDVWPDAKPFNRVNYNNGTSVSPSPWLASELYAWLNSLQANVPNADTVNPPLIAVDYRTTGVYDKLPAALKNVIVTKRALLPSRYTSGALLSDDNSWAWVDAGKLWLPSEVEVYGCAMWGTRVNGNAYSSGGYAQYPVFAQNTKRIKGAGDGGARSTWWLSTASGGNSTHCANAVSYGYVNTTSASSPTIRAPLCFRIA